MTTSAPQSGAPRSATSGAAPTDAGPGDGGPVRSHERFAYSAIVRRPGYRWPNGAALAVYIGFNIEHFSFGEGMGAGIAPPSPEPDVLNYAWREYGNRVGVWHCLDLFDSIGFPTGALINTALFDHCPEVVAACVARGDEIIAHGHTNAHRQGDLPEARERALIARCRDRIARETGRAPAGWLSPWISESIATSDLLAEEGYAYTLNWCHDDQPVPMRTRSGKPLWSVPYPQEINDIPMIVHRQMEGDAFARMIVDHFDEMLLLARKQPRVMGIALHPYLVGQPHRLRHLRRSLEHIAAERDRGAIWVATPGDICRHVESLGLGETPA